MDQRVDNLLDRIGELLKLCTQADETGHRKISTDTIRAVFSSQGLHPAAATTAQED